MPTPSTLSTKVTPPVPHLSWCVREDARIEQDIAYRDNDAGRSVPSKRVTRCLECGEARYDDL